MQNNHLTTESSINNLKTKVEGIHLAKHVLKNDYDSKVGNLELKIPDISGLLQTSTFNSKVGELETKIKTTESNPDISNLANETELNYLIVMLLLKKTDYVTDITKIKNDYVTNTAFDSKINDLKATHITDEVKKVDDKVTKNTSNILGFESRLKKRRCVN